MKLADYLKTMIVQECETLLGAVRADANKEVIAAITNRLNGFAAQYETI